MLEKGFREHFKEAAEINKIRKIYYSQRTAGKSNFVSFLMIFFERILYPVAWYIDIRAKKFNKKGCLIVVNDFVSLENITAPDVEPIFCNRIQFSDLKKLFKKLFYLRKKIYFRLRRKYDFKAVCTLVAFQIVEIENIEKEKEINFAMIKHILDSIGFASENAIEYTKTGDIKTKKFASHFIKIQTLGTILSPVIDFYASKIHNLGCGIVINDIPKIPFNIDNYYKK